MLFVLSQRPWPNVPSNLILRPLDRLLQATRGRSLIAPFRNSQSLSGRLILLQNSFSQFLSVPPFVPCVFFSEFDVATGSAVLSLRFQPLKTLFRLLLFLQRGPELHLFGWTGFWLVFLHNLHPPGTECPLPWPAVSGSVLVSFVRRDLGRVFGLQPSFCVQQAVFHGVADASFDKSASERAQEPSKKINA